MKHLLVPFALIVGLVGAAGAADVPPDQLVRERTSKIIELLKANKDAYTKDHKQLYAMVNEQVLPYFDFRAMSRLVLGRYWREASEEQRNRFTKEFRDLLVRTYATALLKYTDEEIVYLPFRSEPGDKTATVRTEVQQAGRGTNIPIHYSFYLTDASWKVFDVAIDGVSLVTTYRSTYAEKIRNEGMDALIANLQKTEKADAFGKPRSPTSSGGK